MKPHSGTHIVAFNPNQTWGRVRNGSSWYILLYNFLVTHPNFHEIW